MSETAVTTPAEKKPKKIKKPERELVLVRDGRRVNNCNLCEKLCLSRTQIVNGFGPKGAKYAIIGEAPGEQEDDRGRPFVGPAGITLRNWLIKVGINPDREVYYDNAIKCRPEANKKPTPREIKNCSDHLWAALEEINPDIIIAAGNSAIEALLPANVAAEGITKVRGHIFWNERLQRKIIPMFHPSAVFHDFGQEIFCIADLRKAVKEAKNPTKLPAGLGEYIPLLTVEEVERECARLMDADLLVYDTETSHSGGISCDQAGDRGGLDWQTAQVLCIGLTDQVERAWIVPLVGQNYREIWTPDEYKRVLKALRRLFLSDVPKIAQNGKFDNHMLREAGILVNEFVFDTMLAYSFIQESASHALEPMRSMFTTMPFYDAEVYDLTDGKSHMERAPDDVLWKYCGADVDTTLRVAKELDKLLDKEGDDVRWVFENVSMPAQAAAMHIEERGVLIDMELASHIIEETDRLIAAMEVKLYSALPPVWQDLNYKSPKQLKKLLYVDLKLPKPPILTDTGSFCFQCRDRKTQHWYHTSTNKDAIKELDGAHPVILPLQTVTQLVTLKKTFLLGEEGRGSGLLQHVKSDGRIHTSYRCDAVETGRWSSSPNLQNIPKETDERPEIYKLIRKLFIAPPGRKLVELDFSQIELRILAYLAGETDMIQRFERNEDFHCMTPETPVLTRDLRWVAAGDLQVGDKLLAFEADSIRPHMSRMFQQAEVTHASRKFSPVYKVSLSNGEHYRVTGEHKWLGRRGAFTTQWLRTDEIARLMKSTGRNGKHPTFYLPRWIDPNDWSVPVYDGVEHDIGYIAGIFDGEGWLSFSSGEKGSINLGYSQNPGQVSEAANAAIQRLGFTVRSHPSSHGCISHYIAGGLLEVWRFLSIVRPVRLMQHFLEWDIAHRSIATDKKEMPFIVSVQPDGNAEIAVISSSSQTYIAGGYGVHNTYTARHILWPMLDADLTDKAWRERHDDKRTGAKRVNFGIPYGLTAWGMSQWLHCSEEDASDHINHYFSFFTRVRDYFHKSDRDIKRRGTRKNGFGRTRHFYGILTMQHFGGYRRMLGHMKREAYNYPIQSTAADVLSLATIAIDHDPWFKAHDSFIVLTVHDSVTLEAPDEYVVECGQRVLKHFLSAGRNLTYITEDGQEREYYLPGEGKIGQRWSDWTGTLDVDGNYKENKAA